MTVTDLEGDLDGVEGDVIGWLGEGDVDGFYAGEGCGLKVGGKGEGVVLGEDGGGEALRLGAGCGRGQ